MSIQVIDGKLTIVTGDSEENDDWIKNVSKQETAKDRAAHFAATKRKKARDAFFKAKAKEQEARKNEDGPEDHA